MKHQRRRRKVPKAEVGSVTQVPEYSLHRLLMQSPWRCLKTSTQTYPELDVWPRRSQVEEWPDHAPVLLLVHVFTFLIRIKSCSRTVDAKSALSANHTASRKAGFARVESKWRASQFFLKINKR
jgi:hypothetical protein